MHGESGDTGEIQLGGQLPADLGDCAVDILRLRFLSLKTLF
jgi:hypothetical protein